VDNMAILKTSFLPKGATARGQAKEYLRYIENRRGKDGEKVKRTLWGIDGKMERGEAYRMIDEEVELGNIAYRIILNFDPEKEDTYKDIYLQDITQETMIGIENVVGQPVQWVASLHDDHTALRHVHILAMLPRKLRKHELPFLRGIATEAALEQRRQRDGVREHTHNKEDHREEGHLRQRERSK
jgi:hypothetical protein